MDDILLGLQTVLLNIYCILFLFILLVTSFHFLWVYRRPLPLKTWKRVEYIWVTLAFISTLGLIEDSRQVNAQLMIAQEESKVAAQLVQVENWFENYLEFACVDQVDVDHCKALTKMTNDLALIIGDEEEVGLLPVGILDPLNTAKLSKLTGANAKGEIIQRIERYNAARADYMLTLENANRSWLRLLIAALTPLFITFALALKMTKVTAEYLAYNK